MGECVVFDLISGHNFQGKYLYFDKFFTSLRLLGNLKLQTIKACRTVRADRADIPSDFAKKNKMELGDCKSMVLSNSIVFMWMNIKQIFLASNYHKDNEVVPIPRRLKNGQRITIECWKAVKGYNQFSHGVDQLSERISYYDLDRKSKRNCLRIFIYFLNASICNSFICYNQLAQEKLTYLNYMVSVAKSLCSGSEGVSRGRLRSENKARLVLSKTVLIFVNEMHLPVKGKRRRCAYCSNKERDLRSNIEYLQIIILFKRRKNFFFDYHTIFE